MAIWGNKTSLHFLQTAKGAQWLGGRMLDLRPRSCRSKLALCDCPRARHIDLCSVQDQHRMARPDIAEF